MTVAVLRHGDLAAEASSTVTSLFARYDCGLSTVLQMSQLKTKYISNDKKYWEHQMYLTTTAERPQHWQRSAATMNA